LPSELWSGEALAWKITHLLANCVGADVVREREGIHVHYRL